MGHDANENLAVAVQDVDWTSQASVTQRREPLIAHRNAVISGKYAVGASLRSGCGGKHGAQCTGLSWRDWCSEDGDEFVVLILEVAPIR